MMQRLRHLALLGVILLLSCNEMISVISTPSAALRLEKFYGMKMSDGAQLYWEIDPSTEATQLGLYRHLLPSFSYESAVRFATLPVTDSMKSYGKNTKYLDTTVVNGSIYYYTLVAEKTNGSGDVTRSLVTSTISIPVFDYNSITGGELKYSQHIQPIFSGSCAIHGCHGGDAMNGLLKSNHGGSELTLTSWENAMAGTEEIAQIVPYKAVKSHIIQHLNTDTLIAPVASPTMPPAFSFSVELRDALIRWIDAGAKNDDGSVAYSAMPSRGWAYVTNQGEDLTAVIDLDKNRIARYITTGVINTVSAPPQAPHNVIVDWQNQFYFINLIGGSKLLKFRVSDNQKMGELASGLNSPAQAALSRNGDTAYVSNFENSKTNITLVNTTTMTKLADVGSPAMLKPHGITITPNFRYVIVSNSLSDNVSVIRTSDNTIIRTIPVSGNVPALPIGYAFQYEPYQSVITPDSKYAYVTCRKSGDVRVIDLDLMNVIDSIPVGNVPMIPAITPDGAMVFVTNRNSSSVTAITTATRKPAFTVSDIGVEPHGIAVSKDGKYVYVSCENLGIGEPPHHATSGGKNPSFLKVIDIGKRSVVASIELGNFGSGMAVTQ
ncbi:MAG: hypothetical protein WCW35_07970 [Bacteroidota bacterium]